ncbi:hypothetical protein QBC44DRAFT_78002 [Cladorrhinum sp. PSN332]|nr:hypothetical protein QBC44DRAFT_78002 [Cladorrhinum sp. PSN332]
MSSSELLTAYRKLLRSGLRAVQFSKPSRYIIRDQLRDGFRDTKNTFEPERIRRTIWFFNAAAADRGMEHKILKNLCRVRFERVREMSRGTWKTKVKLWGDKEVKRVKKGEERLHDPIQAGKYGFYDLTVKMLNDSMGMCLR